MANMEHLAILKKGVKAWNRWREENAPITHWIGSPKDGNAEIRYEILTRPNLAGASLGEAILTGADLTDADLTKADLTKADLTKADLSRAILCDADLSRADLSETSFDGASLVNANLIAANLGFANLAGADLTGADLTGAELLGATLVEANLAGANLAGAELLGANLTGANLTGADLTGADLTGALFIEVQLDRAILNGCRVFGISAWKLKDLEEAEQSNLVITDRDEPVITVDNLEVAQFIYLMLHSEKIRGVIDTLTSKAVLILGRFTGERKEVLDAIEEELRIRDYVPILFDWDKPSRRDLDETITLLARMARFIIADITDAKSIPAELRSIVPNLPSVPVQPLILSSQYEYALFGHIKSYPWVLEVYKYNDIEGLLGSLDEKVIAPAEAKAKELQKND